MQYSPHSERHTPVVNFTDALITTVISHARVQTSITILLHLPLHVARLSTMPPVVIVNRHQPVLPVIMTTFIKDL